MLDTAHYSWLQLSGLPTIPSPWREHPAYGDAMTRCPRRAPLNERWRSLAHVADAPGGGPQLSQGVIARAIGTAPMADSFTR